MKQTTTVLISKTIFLLIFSLAICLSSTKSFSMLHGAFFLGKYMLNKYKSYQINKFDEMGTTQLYKACEKKDLKTIKELFKNPFLDVNKNSKFGDNPLCTACSAMGNLDIAKEMLKHPRIDVNKTSGLVGYYTPLGLACIVGKLHTVKELLKHPKININKTNKYGNKTPLYFACFYNNLNTVKELLKHPEILINKGNKFGKSPLYCAWFKSHLNIVKLLLQNSTKIDNQIKKYYNDPVYTPTYNELTIYYELKIKKYIKLTETYNKSPNKLHFIFSKKDYKNTFDFLVKLAFGRAIQDEITYKHIRASIFYKIYKSKKVDLENKFGTPRKEKIFDFIQEVVKNRNNCFRFDKSHLKSIRFSEKLNNKRKNNNYTDVAIKTTQV
ncbi:ankyrin repeat domain-containing protein [Candidatus Dependentiae bacterium]